MGACPSLKDDPLNTKRDGKACKREKMILRPESRRKKLDRDKKGDFGVTTYSLKFSHTPRSFFSQDLTNKNLSTKQTSLVNCKWAISRVGAEKVLTLHHPKELWIARRHELLMLLSANRINFFDLRKYCMFLLRMFSCLLTTVTLQRLNMT